MKIAIVKYNAGNIFSVRCALARLGHTAEITDEPDKILSADKVIFPGVGEAGSAMDYLRGRRLDELIRRLRQPVLGICIGQQLLCRHSDEGDTPCIGVFDVDVRRFEAGDTGLKIPHMGWNTLSLAPSSFIPERLEGKHVYFVHSYYVPVNEWTAATTDYICDFSAAMRKDNFYSTQFHPEKSGDVGEEILKSFIES